MQNKIELGKTYRDKVTGFTGVAVTAVCDYLLGPLTVKLQPVITVGFGSGLKADKISKAEWFDMPRIEVPLAHRTGVHPPPATRPWTSCTAPRSHRLPARLSGLSWAALK